MQYREKTKEELISELKKMQLHIDDLEQGESYQRERYLQTLNKAKNILFTSNSNNIFQEFLDILGEVSKASRTYIFLNHISSKNENLMSQKAEFCLANIKPEIDNPNLQNLRYDDSFPRWYNILSKGKLIFGKIKDFPKEEKDFLTLQGIKAVLIIPIIVNKKFIGFIGFDNCISEIGWNDSEQIFLQSAADDLGQFIEKKRIKEELLKSEFKYRELVESANTIILRVGIDGNITFFNKYAQKLFGFSEEEILGRNIIETIVPKIESTGRNLKPILKKIIGNCERYPNIINENICKDGTRLWISWSNKRLLDENKKHIGTLSIGYDITKQKKAEDALKESQNNLLEAQKVTHFGNWFFDILNNEIYWSDEIFKILGYKKRKLSYKWIHSIILKEDLPKFLNAINDTKTGNKKEIDIDFRIICKNGEIKYIHDRWKSFYDNNGIEIKRIGIIQDITERKYTEEELQKMQGLKNIGTLAGGIAHDFNNILLAIFGNISLLKTKISEDHPGFKFLDPTEQALTRATHLTNQLLTFSKGGTPSIESHSLYDIIKDVVSFDLSGSNVKLILEGEDDLWFANVDKGQMNQLFSNLALNADQAMPDGGHIYISLTNIEIDKNQFPTLIKGKYIKVIFRDEGNGIEAKHINHIFNPYYTTKERGNGIGLATVHSIIDKHKGHVEVTSIPQKGTTFTLYIPATSQIIKKEEVNSNKDESIAKILIMDDDEMIQEVLREMIKVNGMTSNSALDGNEAIKMYKEAFNLKKTFDIIIMDLTIPGGMGGEEAIKHILAIDPAANCIVSSGYADAPIIANYQKYGFKGIIAKPFSITELNEVINKVLDM